MVRTKGTAEYRNPREVHHIVAKKAKNASYAREILDAVGIDYNSSYNLVSLKIILHRRLHTNTYYGWANSVVISAYNAAGSDPAKQRSRVLNALRTLRCYLIGLDSSIPG